MASESEAVSRSGLGPLHQPFEAWSEYVESTATLVDIVHAGAGWVASLPEWLNSNQEVPQQEAERVERRVERAQREVDAGFPTLHAHNLLGLWGALERLVEDITVNSILHTPEVLEHQRFSRIKLPVSVLTASAEQRARGIVFEATRNGAFERNLGVNQFERVLELVNLDGEVPRNVQEALFQAQQIRHVWAHRGGVADEQFAARCPSRGNVGDRLEIGSDEFSHLMHGAHMYGWTVLNRYLAATGQPRYTGECSGYEGTWESMTPLRP